jgi:hypothetical protein
MGLFRLLLAAIIVWSVCRFIYKLGQRSMLDDKRRREENTRKKVDSSVVDKE